MEFIFTKHARQRMYEKKITVEEVKATVNCGMKWPAKDAKNKDKWHAKMSALEVVFERTGKYIIIITVYWE